MVEQTAHLLAYSTAAAVRFVDAVESAYRQLLQYPAIGRVYESARPDVSLRVWGVPGFPKMLIFYIDRPNSVEIVRVLHGARDLPAILSDEFDR